MDVWSPAQYAQFQAERSKPFWDLAGLIDFAGTGRLLDVGCGTGQLTRDLHEQQKIPFSLGIDASPAMLAEAAKLAEEGLYFSQTTVEKFSTEQPFDVVISNAALQWVGGHRSLFPRILTWLRPGGQLAVQMPANFDHPSHVLAEEFGARFGLNVRKSPVMPMEEYAQTLLDCGATDVNVFTKLYLHPMPSSAGVVEWVKGTLLTHYEKQMDPARYGEFLRDYSSELIDRLGDGPYLYTFKRLFVYARV